MRIAARIRREMYRDKYVSEFTIRVKRPSGTKTEFRKIVEGFGDWMFYGFEYGDNIFPWYLIDLSAFRAHLIEDVGLNQFIHNPSNHRQNGDGTTFLPFDLSKFGCFSI